MTQPETLPLLYEAGTLHYPGIAALLSGVQEVQSRGVETIRRHLATRVNEIRGSLSALENVALYPTIASTAQTSLFSFNIENMDPEDVGYILKNSYNIHVRAGLRCAPLIHRQLGTAPKGTVRVSPSIFTTRDDAARFVDAVRAIAGAMAR